MEAAEAKKLMSVADLKAAYPAVFGNEPKPLKIGILEDIMALHRGEVSTRTARKLLHFHTRRRDYLGAVAAGGDRYALDGSPAGKITEREALLAKDMLTGNQPDEMSTEAVFKQHRAFALSAFQQSGMSVSEFAAASGVDQAKLMRDLDIAREEQKLAA